MKTIGFVAGIILMTIFGACSSQARLGESEQDLTNRYGAVIQESTNNGLRTLTFNFKEYLVLARLRDGKSVTEFAYVKQKGQDFNEGYALAIASKMAGATNWSQIGSGAWEKNFGVKGTELYASLSNKPGSPHSLMVTTTQELKRSASESDSRASGGF